MRLVGAALVAIGASLWVWASMRGTLAVAIAGLLDPKWVS